MQQIGKLDSAFINLENPVTPQHIGGLGIYDPATAPGGFVRFKDVLTNFDSRLRRLPLFRTRIVNVTGGLDRPYWVEDKNYDVEFHIRHISLPKPGDWRQLWIQIARLHSRPLDMSRPLWECYVIEGLDNIEGLPEGAFAIYTKLHHSLVDGAGGSNFMTALHDLEPAPKIDLADQSYAIISDRQPTQVELLTRAVLNSGKETLKAAKTIGSKIAEVGKYGYGLATNEYPLPAMSAPKCRFNQKVGPHRVAEALTLNLSDIKRIKTATSTTVNDVCIAIVSGGMRRYLLEKNELPAESLMTGIPLNMRLRVGETDDKNQVGSTLVNLHTDIEEPLERLQTINATMITAKADALTNPMVKVLGLSGFMVPAITKPLARLWARRNLGELIPLKISTVITNVPGPNFPLYCAGAEMARYYALGLLTPHCGLFHAIYSSNGLVTLTILADRDIMPDPDVYVKCLNESFNELLAVAVPEKSTAKKSRPQKARAKKVKAMS